MTARLLSNLAVTRGTVVENVWRTLAKSGASYYPVIEFRTPDGRMVRFTDGVGTYPAEYQVGTEVEVLYDPNNVGTARVMSWKRIWLEPTLMTFVATKHETSANSWDAQVWTLVTQTPYAQMAYSAERHEARR